MTGAGAAARVHLNTAGAGRLPAEALARMTAYLAEEAATGAYETEAAHADFLQHGIYRQIGDLVGADPADVALFDNATRGWITVIPRLAFRPGERIWITPYEYAGSLIALHRLAARDGLTIETVPIDGEGDLDLDWMRRSLDDQVALVSVVHVPSGCGIVHPIEAIGEVLRGGRAVYAVDACQSVGQVEIDVRRAGCDLLTAAGRKFLAGPRGTGFAVVREALRRRIVLPLHDLHAARVTAPDRHEVTDRTARGLELEERNFAGLVGLGAAIEVNRRRDAAAQQGRYDALLEGLGRMPGIRLLAPGRRRAGIASFVHDRLPARALRAALAGRGIDTWVAIGHHTPIWMARQGVTEALRVSPGADTTDADMERFLEALTAIT